MPTYAVNKRARFDYEILDTFEAGLVLEGHEVKSIRDGGANLSGSFVTFHGESAELLNMRVSPYCHARPSESYNPERTRKLLLNKKEILYLKEKAQADGLTVVPLSIYTKGPRIKVEVGLAKGKKAWDKRETIKKRDIEREVRRMKSEV